MSFNLPTFNLTCNLYTGENFMLAPRLSPTCNLSLGRRSFVVEESAATGISRIMPMLLLPKGTDIRSPWKSASIGGDGVEVPAGSGRYYAVLDVDDMGKGFSNEYRLATLFSVLRGGVDWVLPYP